MLSYRHNTPPINGPRVVTLDREPLPKLKAGKRITYDWEKIEARAKLGLLPPAPKLSPDREYLVRNLKRGIIKAARSGDLSALTSIEVPAYNSTVRILKRYRDICITALRNSRVAS